MSAETEEANKSMDESVALYAKFLEGLPDLAKPIGRIMNGIKVGSGESLTIWPREPNSNYESSPYYEYSKSNLVHFTSIEAAIGMLTEGYVRLGTLNHANDPEEILYGISDFKELRETHIDKSVQKDVFSLFNV